METRISQHFDDTRRYVLRLIARHAYRTGDFTLKCGLPTTEIVDCSRIFRTRKELLALASVVGRALEGVRFKGIGGPITGADPIAMATLLVRQNVYWCGAREADKGRGINVGRVVGPVDAGHFVVAVEDVLTSGASLIAAIQAFREAGALVLHALALVDREDERLTAHDDLRTADVQLRSIFTLAEVRAQAETERQRQTEWKRYPREKSA